MKPIKKLSVPCAGCRRQLPSKIRYCPHCGTKLPVEPLGVAASQSISRTKAKKTMTRKKEKLSLSWWMAYILLLFLLAAIVFAILTLASTLSYLSYPIALLY